MLFILYVIGACLGLASLICFFVLCNNVQHMRSDIEYIAKKLHDKDYE